MSIFFAPVHILFRFLFNLFVHLGSVDTYLSARLHEHRADILNLKVCDVQLGQVPGQRVMRRQQLMTGAQVFQSCLTRQQELCEQILLHMNRLPETTFFLAIESALHPRNLVGIPYQLS